MRRSVSKTLTDHRNASFYLSKHRNAIAFAIAIATSLCGFVVKRCARYARHHCIIIIIVVVVVVVVVVVIGPVTLAMQTSMQMQVQ